MAVEDSLRMLVEIVEYAVEQVTNTKLDGHVSVQEAKKFAASCSGLAVVAREG